LLDRLVDILGKHERWVFFLLILVFP
jgi:hypothetical protein